MSNERFYFCIVILFVLLSVFSTIFSYVEYRKHLPKYERLLASYRQTGLFLDTATNFSSNFGFILYYMKVMFFIRLLKDRKMYKSKGVLVGRECYNFLQSISYDEIKWIWIWRRNYLIQSFLMALTMILAYAHSIIYNW